MAGIPSLGLIEARGGRMWRGLCGGVLISKGAYWKCLNKGCEFIISIMKNQYDVMLCDKYRVFILFICCIIITNKYCIYFIYYF